MSRVKTKLNTCATLNALSLKNDVRNMLRRNMAVMEMHSTGEDLDAEQRKKLKKETPLPKERELEVKALQEEHKLLMKSLPGWKTFLSCL